MNGMNTNHLVRSFTLCVISLCLLGWSLVASASAATIVVTSNQDVADPPFTTANFCGSGTIANLPGADGKVSLREAIVAANNTPGQHTISFASNLNGKTIVLTSPLFLCGGNTTLNGDINGDDAPDVTVDGTAAVTFLGDVINLVSSHNTVKHLRVLVPPASTFLPAGISVSNLLATTVTDNVIIHNVVSGGPISVKPGFDTNGQVRHAVNIKRTIVRDNITTGIVTIIFGNHNSVTDFTIAHNTISGVHSPFNLSAIVMVGGRQNFFDPTDPGASENQLDVTIVDNTITGNSNPNDTAGITISGGLLSSSHNLVSARILNNTITDNIGRGINVTAGLLGGSDNDVDVTVRNNIIQRNSAPGDTAGISVLGGFASSSNHLEVAFFNNSISNNNGGGITVGSGLDNSSHNDVEVAIRDNTLENNGGVGILTYSGLGALIFPNGDSSGNSLEARIERNTVRNAFLSGIWVAGGIGSFDGAAGKVAHDNEVDVVVSHNTVTGTVGEGILLTGGGSGLASSNEVEIRVRKNTVCGSAAADIGAVGGFLGIPATLAPNQGTGNKVEGEISRNTATNVVVTNGVAGNAALVTGSKNVRCP